VSVNTGIPTFFYLTIKSPSFTPKNPARFFRNLLFTIASYKKAADVERVRRQEWEQNQEGRQLQMEKRLSEMQTEMEVLREYIRSNHLPVPGEPPEVSEYSFRVSSKSFG